MIDLRMCLFTHYSRPLKYDHQQQLRLGGQGGQWARVCVFVIMIIKGVSVDLGQVLSVYKYQY